MPSGWVGTTGSNRKEIYRIRVGTPAGTKEIKEAWVGTTAGNKRWFQRAYDLSVTAEATAYNQVKLVWNPVHPSATYVVNRLSPSVGVMATTLNFFYDDTVSESTNYTYRIDSIRNGAVYNSATVAVSTPAAPVPDPDPGGGGGGGGGPSFSYPAYQSSAYRTTSWEHGPNWTIRSTNHIYCGYTTFSTGRGHQKSICDFGGLEGVRNCYAINKVYVKARFMWADNDGVQVGLVIHHNDGRQGAGSTGVVGYRTTSAWNPSGNPRGADDVWWANDPDGWVDVTDWVTDRGYTVAEEFRTHGADGFGFMGNMQANNGNYAYGYGRLDLPDSFDDYRPSLRIEYTVLS